MTGPTALPVAVTMGDPAGIGGELVLRTWMEHRRDLPPFFVIDDPGRLSALALSLKFKCAIQTLDHPSQTGDYFDRALPVIEVNPSLTAPVTPGKPEPAHAPVIIGAIDQAVEYVQMGDAAAFVTNPIHKASLRQEGFAFPGHTEYLSHRAGSDSEAVMMLVTDDLRVVPVTIHIALKDAADALTQESIVRHGVVTAAALTQDFGIAHPRLAVAALNPHAGENGAFGQEELEVIAPAVSALQQRGLTIDGPRPADTLFHADARAKYDAVLCMYHDQALIPLKTLDFYGGVNVTLGLPFVRTSPDHGTAFDIAGTGVARCDSLVAAIRLAADIAAHRDRT